MAATVIVSTAAGAPKPNAPGGWTHAAAWGFGASGQLGDGGTVNRVTPVGVRDPGLGFVEVASGGNHSAAIAADGTVWTWGGASQSAVPVQVPGLTGVTRIAAGRDHTLAVRSDGTVWAWGANENGQLGDGTQEARDTPVQVPGLGAIVEVAAGTSHSLAVRSDGRAFAWGWNQFGQLGDVSEVTRLSPVPVHLHGGHGTTIKVVKVAAGMAHSMALTSSGSVYTWGQNGSGQLGDGTSENRNVPGYVYGGSGTASAADIAAGENHSIAALANGTVLTWGDNFGGQLGDGTTTARNVPGPVPGLTGVTQVTAGFWFSAARRGDGTVRSWGLNYLGQLGDGTTTNRLTPVPVPGLTGVTEIDAGLRPGFGTSSHTLVVRPVAPPGFRLELERDAIDLPAGSSVTTHVTVVPLNGSHQVISLAPAPASSGLGLPTGVTVEFGSGSIPVGETVTVTFTADLETAPSHGESSTVALIGTASLPASSATTTLDILITDPMS
ncbi:hypothetical protein [Acrocarpospora sp. B8E8]|uniref:RCC1-like domain-containing protein n=1 Tax=Acrocarpospora sp. B8E8 TaxID=3153572 RepID=UPI00325E3AD2